MLQAIFDLRTNYVYRLSEKKISNRFLWIVQEAEGTLLAGGQPKHDKTSTNFTNE